MANNPYFKIMQFYTVRVSRQNLFRWINLYCTRRRPQRSFDADHFGCGKCRCCTRNDTVVKVAALGFLISGALAWRIKQSMGGHWCDFNYALVQLTRFCDVRGRLKIFLN